MKIVSFRAENVKRLSVVEINPTGNIVEITGQNGSGKTSVLDSVWWALRGTKVVQDQPIRKGTETASIALDLGKLKITRKFRAAKDGDGHTTSLTVENEDGQRFANPQSILDAIYGELTFDPLAFTRMKPKEQFDALKQFVPGVDFEAIDKSNATDFAARTDINRRASDLRAQAAGIQVPDGEISEREDESALLAQLASAGDHNAAIERARAVRGTEVAAIERDKSAVAGIRARADALRQEAIELDAQADESAKEIQRRVDAFAALPPLDEPISTADVSAKIAAARVKNDAIDAGARAIERRDALTAQAIDQESKSAALTAAMNARTKTKEDAVAAAKLPVTGITFGEGSILLNGVPFDQASDAEQLRASVEIAAAMNPKLRIIRVRDGSLLDSKSMKILGDLAEKSDMQIWIETVDSNRSGAVVLEDGHVRGAVQQAAE